jgi:hypothetical protein
MKLITVLGATPVTSQQRYSIDDKIYEEYFAFLAMAHALAIPDENIIVIGTEQTLELLSKPLYAIHPAIIEHFIHSSDNIDELFEKCLSMIDDDTVLELTQGFRHLPMTLLLSGIAASSEKRLSNIYYAKTTDSSCNPTKDICTFEFISLTSYLDRANLNAIIDSFCTSYVVPKLKISFKEFVPIEIKLHELSRHLMGNNLSSAIQSAIKLKPMLESLKNSRVAQSITELNKEIEMLCDLNHQHESLQLYNGAKMFYQKELLLHAVTNLFEAVSALMDETVSAQKLTFTYFDHKDRKTKNCLEHTRAYNRRNCLKKGLRDFLSKHKNHAILNMMFHTKLKQLDEMRNHSAHAHATENAVHEYKREIGEMFVYFDSVFKES